MAKKKRPAKEPVEIDNVDHTVACLAIARAHAQEAIESIDAAMLHFADPSSDKDGSERGAELEAADEALGEASRAIQESMRCFEEHEATDEVTQADPDEEDDDDEDDEDD